MRDIATKRQKTVSQVALNWCICKGTLPIVGVKNEAQLTGNNNIIIIKFFKEYVYATSNRVGGGLIIILGGGLIIILIDRQRRRARLATRKKYIYIFFSIVHKNTVANNKFILVQYT